MTDTSSHALDEYALVQSVSGVDLHRIDERDERKADRFTGLEDMNSVGSIDADNTQLLEDQVLVQSVSGTNVYENADDDNLDADPHPSTERGRDSMESVVRESPSSPHARLLAQSVSGENLLQDHGNAQWSDMRAGPLKKTKPSEDHKVLVPEEQVLVQSVSGTNLNEQGEISDHSVAKESRKRMLRWLDSKSDSLTIVMEAKHKYHPWGRDACDPFVLSKCARCEDIEAVDVVMGDWTTYRPLVSAWEQFANIFSGEFLHGSEKIAFVTNEQSKTEVLVYRNIHMKQV